jgi:GTP-binding protein LepA
VNPQPETYWGNVNPIGIRGVYDEAKRFAEAMTMAYHRHHGVDVRIVRIFNTFGPRMQVDDGRAIPNFFRQAIRGEDVTLYGDGSQTRSFIYVDDQVEGILRLLRSSYVGPVNIGNPNELSLRQMAEKVVALCGGKSRIVSRPLPPDDPKVRRPDITPRAARARRLAPRVQVEEGLARTHAYFVSELARPVERQVNQRIRNFCIIAHIDHGKSTLADRLLDATGTLTEREKRAQFLDKMDLERERGITIKAQTARMRYTAGDGQEYILNLIDTPGHVDFSYEVSRALSGVRGRDPGRRRGAGDRGADARERLSRVDAGSRSSRSSTRSTCPPPTRTRRAGDRGRDRTRRGGRARPCRRKREGDRRAARADRRGGAAAVGRRDAPPRALVFDSWFDPYVGAVMLVRVVDGRIAPGQRILLMAAGVEREIQALHVLDPHPRRVEQLAAGEVGMVVAGIKTLAEVRIGDTLTDARAPAPEPLPGFQNVKPMVFTGLYPVDADAYADLKDALEKLKLNDASLAYEPETSNALGFGFRCGFLGFLHSEIVQERLEREYNLDLITTAPTVRYRVVPRDGEPFEIETPAAMPAAGDYERVEEPMILATLHLPPEYVGAVLALCEERRGTQRDMTHHGSRIQLRYELPLSEVVLDFHDRIKSATRGYGSFDYDLIGYAAADLVRLDVLVNGDPVDALSLIVHREKAFQRGTDLVRKLKEFIPRQQYEVALQAAIGSRVIARTNVKALRKNVTAKCYGGDISRKRKLLEKQKEGKRRMKRVGSVEIPQEAFLAALRLGDE